MEKNKPVIFEFIGITANSIIYVNNSGTINYNFFGGIFPWYDEV